MKEASQKQLDFIDRLVEQKGVSDKEISQIMSSVRKVINGTEPNDPLTMSQAKVVISGLMAREDSPDHLPPKATDRQISYIKKLTGDQSVLEAVGTNWHKIEDGDNIKATIEAADFITVKQASSLIEYLKFTDI